MNLLRHFLLLRQWRRVMRRRRPARAVYTVTVPASLSGAGVIELRRPVVVRHPAAALPRVVNG